MDRDEIVRRSEESFREVTEPKHKKIRIPDDLIPQTMWDSHNVRLPQLRFGDWILMQKFSEHEGEHFMHYPQLGIFRRYGIMDQAITLEFMEPVRTWMYNVHYNSNPDPQYNIWMPVSESSYVQALTEHIEWFDAAIVYGSWSGRPSLKQLLEAYRKTQWFKQYK